MEALPFIGGITKYHLARNLGMDVVKPDIHLVRMANWYGFTDTTLFCESLGLELKTSYRLGTLDLIAWRYGSDYHSRYLIRTPETVILP